MIGYLIRVEWMYHISAIFTSIRQNNDVGKSPHFKAKLLEFFFIIKISLPTIPFKADMMVIIEPGLIKKQIKRNYPNLRIL